MMPEAVTLTTTIYGLLGFIIVSVEAFRYSRRRTVDALTFFSFFYFLFFVLAPVNVLLFGETVVRQKYAYHAYGPGDEITALCLMACYVLFLLGYMAVPSAGKGPSPLKMGPAETYSLKKAARIAVAFFFIGALAMAYNVAQVGGLLEVIRQAPNIRSGEFEIQSKFVFVRQFISFLSCAFVLYLVVYLGKRMGGTSLTAKDRVLLIVMGIAFFYYALGAGGRREFVYPVLLYFLVSSCAGRSFGLRNTIFVVLLLLVGVATASLALSGFMGVDEFLAYRREVIDIAYLNTVQGVADSYIHFVGMQHAELWQFGFLKDFVELPLQLIPSRLFDFERGRGVFGETSQFFLGEGLADNLSGEEPPGFHGYLLVNFGYFGMFVWFFFLGAGYRFLHNLLRPAQRQDAIAWLIYWWVFFGFLVLFREGVLALALKQHASWWLAIALLMLTRRRRAESRMGRLPLQIAEPYK